MKDEGIVECRPLLETVFVLHPSSFILLFLSAARALKLWSFDWMKQAQACGGAYSRPLAGITPYWQAPRTQ